MIQKCLHLILIAPVVQLTFLGFAANLDIKLVRTIVFDQDKSTTSRDFIERFTSSGYFKLKNMLAATMKLQMRLIKEMQFWHWLFRMILKKIFTTDEQLLYKHCLTVQMETLQA